MGVPTLSSKLAMLRRLYTQQRWCDPDLDKGYDELHEAAAEYAQDNFTLPSPHWPPMSRLMYLPNLLAYYVNLKFIRVQGDVQTIALPEVPGFVLQVYKVLDARISNNNGMGKATWQHPIQTTKFGVLLPQDSPNVVTGLRPIDLTREILRDTIACVLPTHFSLAHVFAVGAHTPPWLTQALGNDPSFTRIRTLEVTSGQEASGFLQASDYEPHHVLIQLADEFGCAFATFPNTWLRSVWLGEAQVQEHFVNPYKTYQDVRTWPEYPLLLTHLELMRLNKIRMMQFLIKAYGRAAGNAIEGALGNIRMRVHGGDNEHTSLLQEAQVYYARQDAGEQEPWMTTNGRELFVTDQPYAKLLDIMDFTIPMRRDALPHIDEEMAGLNEFDRYAFADTYIDANLPF